MIKKIIALSCLALASCSEVVSSQYASYQKAQEDKLFERGWLPDILPLTTLDIEVNNDLDLNESAGRFIIPEHDLNEFTQYLVSSNQDGEYSFRDDSGVWTFNVEPKGEVSYRYYSN